LNIPDGDDIEMPNAELDGDAGQQFRTLVGLEDVVARSEVEEFDFDVDIVAGGEDNDPGVGAFQTGKEVSTATIWEGEVEEDQIRSVLSGAYKSLA
jgi:hypothetical protein